MNRTELEKKLTGSLLENGILFDIHKVSRFTRIIIFDMIHSDDSNSEYTFILSDDMITLHDDRIHIDYPINQIDFSINNKDISLRLSNSPKKMIVFPIFQ